jgi:hypothetical protein
MKSFTSRRFREAYGDLPDQVRQQARRAYRLLNLKKVDHENGVYSVRVGRGYRAPGRLDGSDTVWFWIGPHGDYDKLI